MPIIDPFDKKKTNIVDPFAGLPQGGRGFTAPQEEPTPEEGGTDRPFPVGALIGGTVGAIAGAPGGPIGIGGGAAIGAAGGEAIEQNIRRALGVGGVPQTSEEAALRIGAEAVLAPIGEGVGRGAAALGGKILRRIAPITDEAARAMRFLESKMPKQQLLPAEATGNRPVDILHNIAESSLIGGEAIAKFKQKRSAVLEQIADEIVDSFGTRAEPDIVGELFLKTVEKNINPSKIASKILYNNLDEMVKGVNVPTKGLKEFTQPLLKNAEILGGVESATSGDELIKFVSELPDEIPFTVAKDLRSRLIAAVDGFNITNKRAPALGKSKKLIQLIDESMGKTLLRENQDAYVIWREADKIYRKGNEEFNNKFIRRLIKNSDPELGGNPEGLVKAIFKPGAVTNLRRAKIALTHPSGKLDEKTWKQLQSYYIQDMFGKSISRETGEILGRNLNTNIFGRTGLGEKSLNILFDKAQVKNLREFTNALTIAQKRQAEGLGKMAVQLTQAGAVMSLPSKGLRGTAATILLAPPLVSWMMTNPTLTKSAIKAAGGVVGRTSGVFTEKFLMDVIKARLDEGFGLAGISEPGQAGTPVGAPPVASGKPYPSKLTTGANRSPLRLYQEAITEVEEVRRAEGSN